MMKTIFNLIKITNSYQSMFFLDGFTWNVYKILCATTNNSNLRKKSVEECLHCLKSQWTYCNNTVSYRLMGWFLKKLIPQHLLKEQIMQTREPTQDLNLKKQTSVISLQGKWSCLFFFFKHSADHSNNSKEKYTTWGSLSKQSQRSTSKYLHKQRITTFIWHT